MRRDLVSRGRYERGCVPHPGPYRLEARRRISLRDRRRHSSPADSGAAQLCQLRIGLDAHHTCGETERRRTDRSMHSP